MEKLNLIPSNTPLSNLLEKRDSFNILRLPGIIRRRWLTILAVFAVSIGLSLIWIFNQPHTYTAEAVIALDNRRTDIQALPKFLANLTPDFPTIRTEMQELQSWPLAMKVISSINLGEHYEYKNPLKGTFDSVVELLSLPDSIQKLARSEPAETTQTDDLANRFHDNLSVITDGRSYTIRVRFRSLDPTLATAVANQLAVFYIEGQEEERVQTIKRVNGWLNDRIGELRSQVRQAEMVLQQFRESNTLVDFKGGTISQQQITNLSNQLAVVSADRAEKEARLNQIRQGRSAGTLMSITEVVSSPLISHLREQEAVLLRREAELSERYGEKHPSMVAILAERNDLRRKIDAEIAKIVQAVSTEAEIARAREATMRASFEALQRRAAQANPAEVRLRELERDVEVSRSVLDSFLKRTQEGDVHENFINAPARIISPAQLPRSSDQTGVVLPIACIISGVWALICAVLKDVFDRTTRSPEQLERENGIACIGLVPSIITRIGVRRRANLVLKQRISLFSEAIRSIHAALTVSSHGLPPKVVLITSAMPGEGKSLMALSFARSAALDGVRALLIDCNFRSPSLGRTLKAPTSQGLNNILANKSHEAVIYTDSESGLHCILAVPEPQKAQELLHSRLFADFLKEMRQHYDLILLDSPPIATVSDSLLLVPLVDATLVIARWRSTKVHLLARAVRRLGKISGSSIAVILNRIDPWSFERYMTGRRLSLD